MQQYREPRLPLPYGPAIKLILNNHSAHISKERKAWLAEQPAGRFCLPSIGICGHSGGHSAAWAASVNAPTQRLTLNGAQVNTGGGVTETTGTGKIVLKNNAEIYNQAELSISAGGAVSTTSGDSDDV